MRYLFIIFLLSSISFQVMAQCPTKFSVSGGGSICGSVTQTVTLSISQIGVNYQLQLNNVNNGAVVPGTGASLSWNNLTAAGVYTVIATNATSGCQATMNNSATVTVYTPTVFQIGFSGDLCNHAAGAKITLNGSEAGVTYTLLKDGVQNSSPISGTGNSLSWNDPQLNGTYTIEATRNACSKTMSGNVDINLNFLSRYNVSGSGSICSGTGIMLSGSDLNISYQLLKDGAASGPSVAGTGNALTWSTLTAAGTYTVVASTTAGCVATMIGNALITGKLPTVFNVSASGDFCGAASITIQLSGSETGVYYQLKKNGNAVGASKTGTGSALTWSNNTGPGTWSIEATNFNCIIPMSGSIFTAGVPQYSVSGGGTVCATNTKSISLSNSTTGVDYQLKINGVNSGSPVPGTGSALTWSGLNTAGTYTITGTNLNSGCQTAMTGSASIIVNTPTVFQIGSSGDLCNHTAGSLITLSGSQTGVTYQLLKTGAPFGGSKNGTGSALSWPDPGSINNGTYTVQATKSGCAVDMGGSVLIASLPILYTVSGGGQVCSPTTGVTLNDSQTMVSYQLLLNGIPSGAPITGTGSAIQWQNQKVAGTYTVTGTLISSGCKVTMTGSAVVTGQQPIVFDVMVNGSFCPPANYSVALSGSETGVSYNLKSGGSLVSTLTGTGSPLTWSNQTSPGPLTIEAVKQNCTVQMNGSILAGAPTTIYTASGEGTICGAYNTGVVMTLSGSQLGVNYQLRVDVGGQLNNIGTVLGGTGGVLIWPLQTVAGVYSVMATNSTTGCSAAMTGLGHLVNNTPVQFNVTGGGDLCGSPQTITLSGSESSNVMYELKFNDQVVDSDPGTGAPISWTRHGSTAGAYTIEAVKNDCRIGMNGIVNVGMPERFTLSGGGLYCEGTSTSLTLSKSELGVNYQLKNGTVDSGSPLPGTGNALVWSGLTQAGNYTVTATRVASQCALQMFGTSFITLKPAPSPFNISGGGDYCDGFAAPDITLSGSQTGVSYTLKLNGIAVGTSVAGTGISLTWTNNQASGTYTIEATNFNGCKTTMPGSTLVQVKTASVKYHASGGGILPDASGSSSVQLSGSETGVNYQLKLNNNDLGPLVSGTGSALTWSSLNSEGDYIVMATKTSTGCVVQMDGTPRIFIGISKLSVFENYSFQYKYDNLNRLVQKKVPGAGWIYTVYDNYDRLVMSQDAEQRKANQWMFIKYDDRNRPVITGLYTHSSNIDQAAMSGLISNTNFFESYDGNTANHGYTNNVFPTANTEILTVTYYDSYDFKSLLADARFDFKFDDLSGQVTEFFPYMNGMATGSKVKIVGQPTYLWSVSYLDSRYRPIQSIVSNHKGGIIRNTNSYYFDGRANESQNTYIVNSTTTTTKRRWVYDNTGRPKQTFHSVNGLTEVLLSQYEYNALGQLIDKKLHSTDNGSTFKQSIDYRYNIRGWLMTINNSALANDGLSNDDTGDFFGLELGYNNIQNTGNSPLFNGNITGVKWSADQGLGDVKERAYNYSYDAHDRLTGANYKEKTATWSQPATNAYSESGYQYDLNGNILALTRKGANGAVIDNLVYDYGTGPGKSNRLLKVTDNGDDAVGFVDGTNTDSDYNYNDNGSLVADKNKNIAALLYNYQNKVERVNKANGDYVKNTYDAGGRKLKQEVFNASNVIQKTTDYVGELILENDALQLIQHEEGRIVPDAGAFVYQYHLRDHQGNVRVSFTTKAEVETTTATLEASNQTAEQSKYLNYAAARRINSRVFDHTITGVPPDGTAYATRLSGSEHEKIGLARSLAVVPGDKIDIEVYAKYVDLSDQTIDGALRLLVQQIAAGGSGAPSGTVIDGSGYALNGTTPFPYDGMISKAGDTGSGPKAYLNWLVFDKNFVNIPAKSGYKRITTLAAEDGKTVAAGNPEGKGHEQLTSHVDITQAGYMYIYLSNEEPSNAPKEVYFDDFKVTQTKSFVIQSNDHYAHGMDNGAFSFQRESSLMNKFLYNGGSEKQTDIDASIYDMPYRGMDVSIGRMMQVDPMAAKYGNHTPYNYAFNMPTMLNDPSGADPDDTHEQKRNYQMYLEERTQNTAAANSQGGMYMDNDLSGVYRGGSIGSIFNSGWAPGANSLSANYFQQQNSYFDEQNRQAANSTFVNGINSLVSLLPDGDSQVHIGNGELQIVVNPGKAVGDGSSVVNGKPYVITLGQNGEGPDPLAIAKLSSLLMLRILTHTPDAVSLAGSVESLAVFGGVVSKGTLLVLTGADRGKSANFVDSGLGLGVDGGAGTTITEYYYLNLANSKGHELGDFEGRRFSMSSDFNIGVLSGGLGGAIAPVGDWDSGVYVIGVSYSYGLGFEGVPLNGNANYGKTVYDK